jgi:hypothetical protein
MRNYVKRPGKPTLLIPVGLAVHLSSLSKLVCTFICFLKKLHPKKFKVHQEGLE